MFFPLKSLFYWHFSPISGLLVMFSPFWMFGHDFPPPIIGPFGRLSLYFPFSDFFFYRFFPSGIFLACISPSNQLFWIFPLYLWISGASYSLIPDLWVSNSEIHSRMFWSSVWVYRTAQPRLNFFF